VVLHCQISCCRPSRTSRHSTLPARARRAILRSRSLRVAQGSLGPIGKYSQVHLDKIGLPGFRGNGCPAPGGIPSGSHQVGAHGVTPHDALPMIGRFDWARSDGKGPSLQSRRLGSKRTAFVIIGGSQQPGPASPHPKAGVSPVSTRRSLPRRRPDRRWSSSKRSGRCSQHCEQLGYEPFWCRRDATHR
jgi:hypothetical protein